MKPEISEVLIPNSKMDKSPVYITHIPEAESNRNKNKSCCSWSKSFIGFLVFFIIASTALTTAVIFRYESKLNDYEVRISLLEEELNIFFEQFEAKSGAREGAAADELLFDDDSSIEDSEESIENSTPDVIRRFDKDDSSIFSSSTSTEPKLDGSNDEELEEDEARFVFGEVKRMEKPAPEKLSRAKRQIFQGVERSEDGVPILQGSYVGGGSSSQTGIGSGSRTSGYPHLTNVGPTDSEGLRLYESLIATRGRGEPKSDDFEESKGTNVQPYHRQSAAWSSKDEQRLQLKSGAEYDPDDIFYTRAASGKRHIENQSSNVFARSSRVPSTGDQVFERHPRTREYQYPPLQRLGRGEGELEQENSSDEFSFVKAEVFTEGPKTYAAHYVADVSNYTIAHRHYDGNGRLRNADGIFEAWKPSDWMAANDGSKEAFSLSSTGTLTVKKDGIYYIYAQIHYLDVHDINGFLVQVNSESFLQCTTMTETHGSTSSSKSNTCFTGGITHLKENDRILIKDIETNRYSIFKPEKSFFGLMRIGNTGGR